MVHEGCQNDSLFQTIQVRNGINMKKVELLSPAGNYESFIGAVNAGADAVYLAGNKYGARAYADNFSEEEVCNAIQYAHLFGRKVYLTVNILLKDEEIYTLREYLTPFYLCGLDGVIVQDLGAFQVIKENFPDMELHASTQMTLTGVYGAEFLKNMGASRIVPARELSIEEIIEIKKKVDIEIEAFVHGAECYSYSGACLFSSILGGRSGNRGRCAQPCRLPYEVLCNDKKATKEEQYILSLKDMCTIQMLPSLIESGIDSFKIEGRMKKPEYTAGVTAIYRKYIDLYYSDKEHFKVSAEDLNRIRKLYIRSEIQDGYYKKHNGKEMITLSKPSYSGSDEALLSQIRNTYIEVRLKRAINGSFQFHCGKPMKCTLIDNTTNLSVHVGGTIVEVASNRPVDEATIKKQVSKTGNTNFQFEHIQIEMDNNIFVPLKSLNELRREAIEQLEQLLLNNNRTILDAKDSNFISKKINSSNGKLQAVVNKEEQLDALLNFEQIKQIFISADCFFQNKNNIGLNNTNDRNKLIENNFNRIAEKLQSADKKLAIAFPYIIRKRSYAYLDEICFLLKKKELTGALVRNIETLDWLKKQNFSKTIVSDASIYCFNKQAKKFMHTLVDDITAPYELNIKELLSLNITDMTIPIYGRIPMMITANCIRKTTMQCTNNYLDSENNRLELVDRYRKQMPVVTNCMHCYNVIYNGQPTSLHSYMNQFITNDVKNMRLDFTTESYAETEKIASYFEQLYMFPNEKQTPPYKEFTKGHLGRGVE